MSSKIKTLMKNTSVLTFSNVAIKAISFFLIPLYTRILSTEDMGISDTIMNFSTLILRVFALCLDWGMEAHFYDEKTESHYKKITSSSAAFFSLSALCCLSLAVFSKPISLFLFKKTSLFYPVILGVVIAAVDLYYFAFRVSTRMRSNMKAVAIISIIQMSSNIVFNLIFVVKMRIGYISIPYSYLLSYIIAAILYRIENRKYISYKCVDVKYTKKLLKYSLPITPTVVMNWFTAAGDRFFIGHYFTQSDVGLYGMGSRIVGFLSVITGSIPVAYASFAIENSKDESDRYLYSVFFDMMIVFLSIMSLGVSIFSKEIIAIMTAPSYHQAYIVVIYLIYAQSFYTLQTIVGYSFSITKKAKYHTILTLFSTIFNITFNIIFTPMFGYIGTSVVNLGTQLTAFVICIIISEKIFPCGYKAFKGVFYMALTFFASLLFAKSKFMFKVTMVCVMVLFAVIFYRNLFKQFFNYINKFFNRAK